MSNSAVSSLTRALALLTLAAAVRAGEDLAKVYPATRDHVQSGLGWVTTPEDVWRLSSFELGLGKGLSIEGKKATVVFGRDGTDVLWAVLFPDKPVAIESEHAGNGERTEAILLRFNPYDIGRVFPAKTVQGPGPAWLRARAARIFEHKLGWKWYTPAGNPTIVPREFMIVDVDTPQGRLFYGVDRTAGTVTYVADFGEKPAPPLEPIDSRAAVAAFDEVFEAFDREYAMFVLLPELDWEKVGKEQRRAAGEVDTVLDLANVVADTVARLEDLHAWVSTNQGWVPDYWRERPFNASLDAVQKSLGGWTEAGPDVKWARTEDGIGYVLVTGLSDQELGAHVDKALEALADTWSLVIDLRANGGGDELLARQVAGRFTDAARVYSKNRYRAGPKHDQLGPLLERTFEPRGPWRYESPVVCLFGRRTMSSAESFALMLAQCPEVTTLGSPTAGSSGNPRRLELECGISVNMPRWIDFDPAENPIERVGVAPDVPVEAAPEELTAEVDPVFATALARLREIPEGERRAGKR